MRYLIGLGEVAFVGRFGGSVALAGVGNSCVGVSVFWHPKIVIPINTNSA
jgi:hypothetical protein